MNKGRRVELGKLKFKKRLRNLNLVCKSDRDYKGYRTTGTPCSCFLCRGEKYSRNIKHKNGENISIG